MKLIEVGGLIHEAKTGGWDIDTSELRLILKYVPIIDVVRCGECSHYNISGCSEGFGWCEKIDRGVTDGHFCSYGAKMEDKS